MTWAPLPARVAGLRRNRSFQAVLAAVALACVLGIAGFATALAVPSAADRVTPRASCTKAQKLRRQHAVSAYRKAMHRARKRYFKRHEQGRLRARFVAGQRARLHRLTRAASCAVPRLAPATSSTPVAATTLASPPTTATGPGETTTAPLPATTSVPAASTTTTVPALAPATVEVVSTGFSQQSSAAATEVDYGVVLRNTSTSTARNVVVAVRARDAGNAVLAAESTTVDTIPPGATYYAGGRLSYPGRVATASVEAAAEARQTVAKGRALPAPANVRVEPSTLGGVVVLGELRNAEATPLSPLARITAVLFDASGKVVGGGYGYPASDVPPGARVGLAVFAPAVAVGAAVRAEVSVEPEYDPAAPASSLVAVLKQGFSEASAATTNELDYGVVLRNLSSERDVTGLHVTVNAVDAKNVVIRSESTSLAAIAAGSTYYFGGWLFHSLSQSTATLEVFVHARGSAPKAVVQPVTGNPRVEPVLGGVRVVGSVTNVASARLSELSSITAVIFDAAGNIVGGGLALPDADVMPGAEAGFAVFAMSVPAARAASAQVSVEPIYH